ncbi:predicted protein, partial [Nematostella vectensis]
SLTPCQKQKQALGSRRLIPDRYTPTCKPDGRFEEVQCNPATSACWCVDSDGQEIMGSRSTGPVKCTKQGVPETECQSQVKQALETPSGKGRFVPRCKADGQFEEVQCNEWTGQCWCVDNSGIEIQGTRTKDFVSCPGQTNSLTVCQYKHQVSSVNAAPGAFVPQCRSDGGYDVVQCRGAVCYCVDKRGIEIQGTRLPIADKRPNC